MNSFRFRDQPRMGDSAQQLAQRARKGQERLVSGQRICRQDSDGLNVSHYPSDTVVLILWRTVEEDIVSMVQSMMISETRATTKVKSPNVSMPVSFTYFIVVVVTI